ncbi:MAG TPA: ATPase [Phycisphaerales bacterium]|nr:ATPase [Phycisphaerales bacterium]
MDTINIICRLNQDDNYSIAEKFISVNLSKKNKFHYTFWEDKQILKLPYFFSDEAIDLFYISLFVYYADRVIPREWFPDAWTRNFKLYLPVLSIDQWKDQKNALERMLSFLSGDKWTVYFRKRVLNHIETIKKDKIHENGKTDKLFIEKMPNSICMLSGGLDSFIGAIDMLQALPDTLFVGHSGGGKGVYQFQEKVKTLLISRYNLTNDQFFSFNAAPLRGKELTTRTRSFMFFAQAIIISSALKKEINLYIPENGLISLNIPLTASRLGSSSTRTTHPYYMKQLQNLLNTLNIKVRFQNPYQFKTKGEMIAECKDFNFLKNNIKNTMSCSHSDNGRWDGDSKPSHCGNCLPCVIRRAAILEANLKDDTFYRDSNFSKNETAVNNLKVYKIGMVNFKKRNVHTFLQIQAAGPIDDNHQKYIKVYERGMKELNSFLDIL